jgi:hypothetical protein
MKIKTSELSGAQLDWAVAHCDYTDPDTCSFVVNHDGFRPSADWAQGGPIIEREGIALGQTADGWEATCDGEVYVYGKTPLIAAMRCYVASKLGEEVEIPTELKGE